MLKQNGDLIPFTASEIKTTIAALPIFGVSFCLDIVAIYALVKQQNIPLVKQQNIPLDTRFIISTIAADLEYILTCSIIAIINRTLSVKIGSR